MPEDQIQLVTHDGWWRVSSDRMLTIPDGSSQLYSNRRSGKFERSLKIDDSIDPDSVDTVLSDGVLQVTMKRRAQLQPKGMSIRGAATALKGGLVFSQFDVEPLRDV